MDNLFFDKRKLKYLGENCIIGKSVRIRKPEECIIGDNTIIDDFTYISSSIQIGRNCHIASNVSISGGAGHFIMEDFSTISNHCSVHCASSDYSTVSLDLPSIENEWQFGGIIKNVKVGKLVTIGAHSCILPGAIIPDGFACGAYTLITEQDYKDWSLYIGIPARFLKERGMSEFHKSKFFKDIYK